LQYNNISIGRSYRNFTNLNRVDEYSVCLGGISARANEYDKCVAIGLNAQASGKRSIAIGYQANATEDDQILGKIYQMLEIHHSNVHKVFSYYSN